MNIEFEEFSEEEFYAVYLMLVSDYPNIADNPHTYIVMAKQFLEDDDAIEEINAYSDQTGVEVLLIDNKVQLKSTTTWVATVK